MIHLKEEKSASDSGVPLAGAQPYNNDRTLPDEINYLRQFIPRVFHLFHWFEAESQEQKLCTVEYLSNMLCWALSSLHRLHLLRSRQLCDEHCPDFESMLIEINGNIISIEGFVEKADDLFLKELDQQPSLQHIVSNSADDVQFFTTLSRDEQLMEQIHRKCLQTNFLLNTSMLMLPANGFRQLAYAVMFGLVLLSLPSQANASIADFTRIYRDSLNAYAASEDGQQERIDLQERLPDELVVNKVSSRNEEITYLSKRKIRKRNQIKEYLAQFGIHYSITSSANSVGRFAANLYAHLNAPDTSPLQKMTDSDLTQYFLLENKLQCLQERIDGLKSLDVGTALPDPKGLFRANVNRSRVHKAISDTLHERKGDHCHVVEAKAHWLAIFRVLEEAGLTQGPMKQFEELMNLQEWFPKADPPCDYRSMKSVPAIDVKTKHYSQWDSRHDRRNAPYKLVADTLVKHLEEQDLL